MQVYRKTLKSHTFNEDRFAVSSTLFAVIDGATDLSDSPSYHTRSHASMLAERVKKGLLSLSKGDVVGFLYDLSRKLYNETPRLLASCGIAVARIKDGFLEIFGLGDCEIVYKKKSGEIIRFKQTALSVLDKKAIDELVTIAKENDLTVAEAKPLIIPTLRKHRALMNTDGGYDVFAPMQTPNFTVLTDKIKLDELCSVYIMTDGFAQAFTTLNILPSYTNLFDDGVTIDGVIEQIKKVSFADETLSAYPRFKIIDDITAIKIDF